MEYWNMGEEIEHNFDFLIILYIVDSRMIKIAR
jgi:hypothetical protein